MSIRNLTLFVALGLSMGVYVAKAGPYSGPRDTDHAIDPAVASNSPRIVGWAEGVDEYLPAGGTEANPNGVVTSNHNRANALGPAGSGSVSLGDLSAQMLADGVAPGSITLTFGNGFRNGIGWDFAVFENGLVNSNNHVFMELAFVEVSSDGVHFARFDGISTNTGHETGGFGPGFNYYDGTNVYNLAGKHAGGYGTTFDLDDLLGHEYVRDGFLDLDAILYVRIVDIVGDGSVVDSEGNPILENWPTIGSGGFDLTGIGYAYAAVPEPAHIALLLAGLCLAVAEVKRRRRRA